MTAPRMPICLSICLSVCLSICLSVRLSVCLTDSHELVIPITIRAKACQTACTIWVRAVPCQLHTCHGMCLCAAQLRRYRNARACKVFSGRNGRSLLNAAGSGPATRTGS